MTGGDACRRGDPAERARSYLLAEHGDLVEAVTDAADEVESRWPSHETADRDAVVEPLEYELDRRGLLDRFPGVLGDAVSAGGFELRATPVAGPPYVVLTTTGPVLRATVSPGRFVIALRVFEVERDPVRYRRRRGGVDATLHVRFVDEKK